jgi:glycosyltransferase involved in cell wall biosynthesis
VSVARAPAQVGLVSVIVPAFQAELYLGEALQSALAQDYEAREVIVVDDGSSDRTATIAAEHDVRLLRRAHGGPAAARNAGLAQARGEFVAILDADDLWPRDRLSRQVAHLRAHPELDIVLGLAEVFLSPDDPRPAHDPGFAEGEQVTGHPASMLARRGVFARVGTFDESLSLSEDIDWLARASDAGVRAGRIERTVLRYRIHAANTSRDHDANNQATLRVLRASVRRKRGVGSA